MADEIIQSSVQRKPGMDDVKQIVLHLSSAYDQIVPTWWSPRRDAFFRNFWIQEPILASAIYSIAARNAAFGWDLSGLSDDVWQAQRLLQFADFGGGWQQLITKTTVDLLVNDNGAFWEIIRPAHVTLDGLILPAVKQYLENNEQPEWFAVRPDNTKVRLRGRDVKLFDSPLDLPIAIAHLDSARVQRTGNPEIPAIYTDVDGKMHRMRWWQIAMFSDMPSPIEEMNGVGTSALSRIFRHAHTLQSLSVYKDEKLSGRFTRSVYITNADPQLIQDQIEQASNAADNVGLQRYSQPVIASTFDPGATPTIAKIDLAQMPDGFDEATTLEWYVSVLALALGVDYGFLAPLPGKGLGTASQSETMARQSRGKSSRLFMDMTANTINFKGILPESVRFRYIERDTEEELAIERVKQMRAETRATMIESGEISSQIARQIASDDGDLPERYLSVIGEQDMTPEVQIAGDDNYNAQQAVNEAGSNSLLTEEMIDEETAPTEESVEQEPIIGVAMLRKGRSFDQKAITARRTHLLSSVPLVTKISNAARKAIGKKQQTELDRALETYKDELEDLARAVSDGTIETDAFVESLASKSALTLNAMFALGYGADDFVRDERLDKMIDINELSASKFGAMIDAYEGDLLDSSLRRLALWMSDAAHAYYLGKVTNPEKQEQRYKFVNGATSDHCDDCVRLDGQVHTASEWDEHSDMLPRSRALKCAGFRCMCELEETDEATNGNF